MELLYYSSLLYIPGILQTILIEIFKLALTKIYANIINMSITKLFSSLYSVSQEERAKFRDGVPYVKLYRYNPKHLYPKLNGYGDNGQRNLKL